MGWQLASSIVILNHLGLFALIYRDVERISIMLCAMREYVGMLLRIQLHSAQTLYWVEAAALH